MDSLSHWLIAWNALRVDPAATLFEEESGQLVELAEDSSRCGRIVLEVERLRAPK